MTIAVRWLERLFLVVLAFFFVRRVAPHVAEDPVLLIFLAGELAGVVLILLQRRGAWATEFYPVAAALLGTTMAMLLVPEGSSVLPMWATQALIVTGGCISLSAKVFLGRSFGLVAANRGVREDGVYRLIRHPMYAGYIVTQTGFLLTFFSLQNVIICAGAWTAQWLRIREEEKFLNTDPAYREYAQRVRYRLIPGIA